MHKQIKCLVIDDDLEDQEIFINALADAFPLATCWFAQSCPQAINKLRSRYEPIPDYIFMDWNLPYMDAKDCIRILRKDAGLANTCIFVLSGLPPNISDPKIVDLGISKVIKKQSSIEMLSRELHDVIKSQWR